MRMWRMFLLVLLAVVCLGRPQQALALEDEPGALSGIADMAEDDSQITEETEETEEPEEPQIREGKCGDNITWVLSDEGVMTLTGTGPMYDYTGGNGDLHNFVPGTAPWFDDLGTQDLETLVVGEGITHIGNSAFMGCKYLSQVTLPESLETIGDRAFQYCLNLQEVNMPDQLESIGDYAFNWCAQILRLTLPETVQSLGAGCFSWCGQLRKISLPEGLTEIPESCFTGSEKLYSIAIPETVTVIGERAFERCEGLSKVTLPAGLKEIRYRAFGWCISLNGVTLPEGLEILGEGAFWYCKSLTALTIPESVTQIGAQLLLRCYALEELNLPQNMTRIPDFFLAECTSLTQVTLPEAVTEIGAYAFSGCVCLEQAQIPEAVTAIGAYAFDRCTGLKAINFCADAPSFGTGALLEISTKVRYPRESQGWDAVITRQYGGTDITWVGYNLSYGGPEDHLSEVYTDLLLDAWYMEAIDYVLETGLMEGKPGSLFAPEETMTRAMAVQVLYRHAGGAAVGDSTFTDVAEGAWYRDAMVWAQENRIIQGFPDGTARPDDIITRQQLATIFRNYAAFLGEDVSAAGSLEGFADAAQVESWAAEALSWAVGRKVLNGTTGNRLDPSGKATRAQAAQMLYNFFEK